MFPIITLQTLLTYDNSLFDGVFALPAGADSDIAIETIVSQYGEMELVWPNWDTMRHMIAAWCRKNARNFERLWSVYNQDYNALWNKDGTIEETRTPDLVRTRNNTTGSSVNTTDNATSTGNRQGFNSDAYQPVTQDISNGSNSSVGNATSNGTDTETGTETTIRTERGNIGVTKTQEMLHDEWQLWMHTNFYEAVSKRFAMDFCTMIY